MKLPDNAFTVQQQGDTVRLIVRTHSESDATALRESIVADLVTGKLSLTFSLDNPRVETITA